MLIAARIGTALFALISLATGSKVMIRGLEAADATHQMDNDHRFYAGIWLALGLGLAYCVPYLAESTGLFRFLMVSLMVGGVARAIGWSQYPPDRRMVVAVVIELVFPTLLVFALSRVAVS